MPEHVSSRSKGMLCSANCTGCGLGVRNLGTKVSGGPAASWAGSCGTVTAGCQCIAAARQDHGLFAT